MTKRWKIVSKWLHRRARVRLLNDTLAALDTPSRLDRMDRPAQHRDDEWTEQKLMRLLHMVMREDSKKAG
jgi:hypothetical protein